MERADLHHRVCEQPGLGRLLTEDCVIKPGSKECVGENLRFSAANGNL